MSIGMSCNFYREINAIHGLLETASQFFDELVFISSPPAGAPPDETIAILEKWGARVEHANINEGFGAVRTKAIHASTCEWVMILDADERFFPTLPEMTCEGTEGYPEVKRPNLHTTVSGAYSQAVILRTAMEGQGDVILTSRRHWFDFTWRRPTQNWMHVPDWQCRIVRNRPYLGFDTNVKMHEQVRNLTNNRGPNIIKPPATIYHDHFHCLFKPMELDQRAEDIRIYDALHQNLPVGSPWESAVEVDYRIGST